MTQMSTGLLPALISYYKRLEADPVQQVASYGFSREKIHFAVVLNEDGSLFELSDIRERNDKGKPIPNALVVPDGGGRSGTGYKPFFCWDNTGYALGRDNKGRPDRAAEMFAAFRERHLSHRDELADDMGYSALCRFLEGWDPARAEELPNWEEAAGQNVVFQLRTRDEYIHQSPAVRSAWLAAIAAPDEKVPSIRGISLLSGEEEDVARLHPQISGVSGANTTGAAIVAFNLDAFESYGKSQSYNAPVGVQDAFRYTTALNRLLADGSRRARIGDATVVFWSDRVEAADAEEAIAQFFIEQAPSGDRGDPAEDKATVERVRTFLAAAREGRLAQILKDPDAPFFILGLSPNASRLNVRFWLAGTVAQFARRLARHVEDLTIGGAPNSGSFLSIQSLLAETARERKDIAPQLAGAVSRAILDGLPTYPEALLTGVIRRVRIDGQVNWRRAAILKAFLKREGRFDVDVYLNKEHKEKAYHCGRLLAVLAFAQEQALGSVNAGVVRRNFGSVMSMPGIMLGRLQKAAEVGHIPKLERDLPVFVRDEIKAINVRLRDDLPVSLSMREQGLFALGFYQELQYVDFVGTQVRQNKRVRTSQGEWVRSKLEARVADSLAKLGLVYFHEPAAILEGRERWPDFVIRRYPAKDLYIEVLGMDVEQYNNDWEIKRLAYQAAGITDSPEGGPMGHLIVLDFRKRPFEDTIVYEHLRPYLPSADPTSDTNTKESDHE